MNLSCDLRWFSVLPMAILAIASIQGCGQSADQINSHHFRVAFDGAPGNIDPLAASSVYSVGLVLATYETLYEYKYLSSKLEITPGLAAVGPVISSDGLTVDIEIRENSKFADNDIFPSGVGRFVTAKDVIFSILRHFDPKLRGQGAWLWRDLIVGLSDWSGDYDSYPIGIEMLDDKTIRFRLSRPSAQFVHTLTTGYSAVIPVEFRNLGQNALQYRTFGSGPFRLESLDTSRAVLVRNENYPKKTFDPMQEGFDPEVHDSRILSLAGKSLPIPSKVSIEFIEDPSARWLSFDNSELDSIVVADEFLEPLLDADNDDLLASEFSSKYQITSYLANEIIIIRFNMDDSDLGVSNDPIIDEQHRLLRCAIAQSIDWDARNNIFFGGDAVVFNGIVPPTLPEFDAASFEIASNRNKKAEAFFQDFLKNGSFPTLLFGHTTSTLGKQNYDLFRGNLVEFGYPGDLIEGVAYSTFGELLKGAHSGRHNITQSSWTLDFGDAENVLQLFYGPNRSPGSNISNYDNADYNRMYLSIMNAETPKTRNQTIEEMLAILDFDCPYSGTATRERVVISNRRVVVSPSHDATKIGRYFKFAGFE